MLVLAHRDLLGLQPRQPGQDRLALVDPHAGRQRVDEQPDHRGRSGERGRTARDDGAEQDVVVPAVAAEQQRPGALDERVRGEVVAASRDLRSASAASPDSAALSSAYRAGGASDSGVRSTPNRVGARNPLKAVRQYASVARTSCCWSQRM